MFFVTIVCRCGQHNNVHDQELERAICSRCLTPLLRPVESVAQPVAGTAVAPPARAKAILAS